MADDTLCFTDRSPFPKQGKFIGTAHFIHKSIVKVLYTKHEFKLNKNVIEKDNQNKNSNTMNENLELVHATSQTK